MEYSCRDTNYLSMGGRACGVVFRRRESESTLPRFVRWQLYLLSMKAFIMAL